MGYKINYQSDNNIVEIKIEGKLNFKIAHQYSDEALKLAHQHNCFKFLFDHTETTLEGGKYKLHMDGATLEQFGFKNKDHIAIVILHDKNTALAKKPDYDVKWSNFRYFENFEEGTNWLTQFE